MTLNNLVEELTATVATASDESMQQNVTGAYVSDLLSDVMGNARAGQVWLTIQTHPNVVAVALLLNLSAIVFTAGQQPEKATVAKAVEEGVALLTTPLSTFEAGGRIHELLKEARG